jgi:hypothetical protein
MSDLSEMTRALRRAAGMPVMDAGEQKWITVNGARIPIGEDGNPQNAAGKKIFGETKKWQSDKESDPAGGEKHVTSWDAGKADKLLQAKKDAHPGKANEFIAREFIKDHLQGRTVGTEKGECIINSTSQGKLPQAASRRGSMKLEAIARVPEVLLHGKAGEMEPLYKSRPDKIDGFIPFTRTVEIGGKKVNVKVKVGYRSNGFPHLVYNLDAAGNGTMDSVDAEMAPASPSVMYAYASMEWGSAGATPANVAQDAADFNEIFTALNALRARLGMAVMDDRWVTVHPNGEGTTGSHVLLGENGEVKAGMGVKQAKAKQDSPKQGKPKQDSPKQDSPKQDSPKPKQDSPKQANRRGAGGSAQSHARGAGGRYARTAKSAKAKAFKASKASKTSKASQAKKGGAPLKAATGGKMHEGNAAAALAGLAWLRKAVIESQI